MTTGKTIALTRWTFVGKVMSPLLNMLSMLQDRSSGSPGMGGTLLCFPTSLCFYLLWPWAPWTVSISQSPLYGLEVPKAAFQHQYDMLEKWRLASWMNEWVVWVPNMCRVEHCQFKSVGLGNYIDSVKTPKIWCLNQRLWGFFTSLLKNHFESNFSLISQVKRLKHLGWSVCNDYSNSRDKLELKF